MENTALPTPLTVAHANFDDMLWDTISVNDGPLSLISFGSGGGGAGSTLETGAPTDNTYSGMVNSITGTSNNNTSKAGLEGSGGKNLIKAGGGIQIIEWRIRLPILSSTPEYNVKVGLQDGIVAGDPANGIYLQYSNTINSGNWRGVTRNSSTSTNVDSSIAVAANTWYKLRFQINAAGTNVDFFVDGTYIGSSTGTIPTTNAMRLVASIEKSGAANATSRTMNIDSVYYRIER